MRRLFPGNAFVPPKMGSGLRLAIAEAPGETEAAVGEPLVGGAGRWFDVMVSKAGLRRENLTLANVIQCRPPDNIFPTDYEAHTDANRPTAKAYISTADGYTAVSHCFKHHVEPLLKARPWFRIDIFGDKPLKFIVGKDEGILKWRGSPLAIPALDPNKPICVPTLHPAFIMRDQIMLPVAINDLRKNLSIPPENYNLYPSIEDVQNFQAKEFAFDIETDGFSDEIRMVGLSAAPTYAMVVPFREPYLTELKRIFRDAESAVGHNCLQFDLPILGRSGVTISDKCEVWDTMLLHHLRFPQFSGSAKGEDQRATAKTAGGHGLEFLNSQFTNKPAWKHDKANYELYCARDVDVTMQAYLQLKALCKQSSLLDLYELVQVPLAKICYLLHRTGFKVDPANLDKVRGDFEEKMAQEETFLPPQLKSYSVPKRKRELAPPGTLGKSGKPVKYTHVEIRETKCPWRSAAKKQVWLYGAVDQGNLGLPVQYDVKKGTITTGKVALDKLKHQLEKEADKEKDPLQAEHIRKEARAIQALRLLNKYDEIISTFCKEEIGNIKRMHPHLNVHGTSSGRLSSSDPNLQNIPESARYIYVPSNPGWKLVEFDFSGIENRLTAWFARDTARLARFADDPKFSEHKYAASKFMGIPYEDVKKSSDPDSLYIKAKKIVHGTNYGEGAKKIADMNDLNFKEVKELLAKWKDEIHETIAWQARCAGDAKRQGYLATPFKRRRWFYTSNAYTESLSFLPQSTAADCIYRAMIALMYERINWPLERVLRVVQVAEPLPQPAQLLLQVHDSLVVECPAEMVQQVITVVSRVMTQPWPELGGYSIPVGIKVGNSWGECEEI